MPAADTGTPYPSCAIACSMPRRPRGRRLRHDSAGAINCICLLARTNCKLGDPRPWPHTACANARWPGPAGPTGEGLHPTDASQPCKPTVKAKTPLAAGLVADLLEEIGQRT